MIHQAGIFLLGAAAEGAQSEPSLLDQVAQLLLGAIPTSLLFIVLVVSYQFLIQGPLSRTLAERRARTDGAVEDAHAAISTAEKRAHEYSDKLRQARVEIYKLREQRIKQWSAERDAALDAARQAASQKVGQARNALDSQAEQARQAIQASAGELAGQVVRAILPVTAGGMR